MDWPDLLLTTSQAVLRFRGGDWSIAHRGGGVYYGLTWNEEAVFVLCRNGEVREGEAESILDLVSGEQFLTGAFSGGHQIHWANDALFICDTGHDRVLKWGRSDDDFTIAYQTGYGYDARHINSVWGRGREFWTGECTHKYKTPKTNWIRRFEMDENDNWSEAETIPVSNGLHNVYKEDGLLYVCDSVGGKFVAFNENRELVKTAVVGGWTRGLVRLRDGWVLGTSQFMAHAKDRYRGDCALYLLNENLRAVDMVILRSFGQIYDIRAVEGDPAHNGLPMPAFTGT